MLKSIAMRWGLLLFLILAAVGGFVIFGGGCHTREDDLPIQRCIQNLRLIDAEKTIWALAKQKKDGDTPTDADLFGAGHELPDRPKCPEGGMYIVGKVGQKPTCSVRGHLIDRTFE